MAIVHGFLGRGISGQTLSRILAQQFVHLVTFACLPKLQQRFVRQSGQVTQRGAGHLLGCPAGETAAEDGQPGEDLSFPRTKPFPGRFKNGPDAPVPARNVSHIRLQKVKIGLNFGADLFY